MAKFGEEDGSRLVDGHVQDVRGRVLGRDRAHLLVAGGLLPMPLRSGGQRLACGRTQPPPVAVLDVTVYDELAFLLRHVLTPRNSFAASYARWCSSSTSRSLSASRVPTGTLRASARS